MPNTSYELYESVAFDRLTDVSDGHGGTTGAWAEQFVCRAKYVHRRGDETVQAARLEGRHLQVIRVRASSDSRTVTTDWRVRDTRSGDVFNIRFIDKSSNDRRWIYFTCEKGVAT